MPANKRSPEVQKSRSQEVDTKLSLEQIESIFQKMFKEQETNIGKIIAANTKLVFEKIEEFDKKLEELKDSFEFNEQELKGRIRIEARI